MKLQKKITLAIGLFLFIVILNIVLGLFRWPFLSVNSFEAVPANTAVFLTFDNWQELKKNIADKAYANDLGEHFLIQQLINDQQLIEQLFEQTGGYTAVLKEAQLLTALHINGTDNLNWIYLLDQYKSSFDLKKFLNGLLNVKVEPYQFKNHPVYELSHNNGGKLAITTFRNLIIVARHSLMVEDAIDQLKDVSSSICRQSSFKKVIKPNDQTDVSVFLNFQKLPLLFASFFHPNKRAKANQIQSLASWSRLDLSFDSMAIKTTGVLMPNTSSNLQAAVKNRTTVDRTKIIKILPDNTAVMTWMGIPDFKQFYNTIKKDNYPEFNQYISPWIGNAFAYVITEAHGTNIDAEKFAVFHTSDINLAEHYLQKYAESLGALKTIEYQNFKINQILSADILKAIFGENFNPIHNPFYTFIDDYVIFCNSRQALEIWLDKYIIGHTLSRDVNFLKQHIQVKPDANILFYVNTSNVFPLIRNYTKPSLLAKLDKDYNLFNKINQVSLTLNAKNRNYNINGHFSINDKQVESTKTSITWKAYLENKISLSPKIVENSANNQLAIFTQDAANKIYLLDRGGELLWKRQLKSSIQSDIFQLDYYNNRDLQFLFNTKDEIYLIDNKGENISGFPIKLQSRITNGLSLLNFGSRNDYAFFIACRNGNVYGYDKTGRPLPGFNPLRGNGQIVHPIQHFQNNGKDYILILNKAGKLSVYGRNAFKRFSSISFDSEFISPLDYQIGAGNSRIVMADNQGQGRVINLSGDSFKLNLNVGDNKNVKFAFANVVGDERKDYIVLSENKISVYYYDQKAFKLKTNIEFDHKQDDLFAVQLNKKDKQYIGTVDFQKNQINLLDENGKVFPDFPLAGSSRFEVVDLFNNGKNILVVANEDGIYAYNIN